MPLGSKGSNSIVARNSDDRALKEQVLLVIAIGMNHTSTRDGLRHLHGLLAMHKEHDAKPAIEVAGCHDRSNRSV